MDKDLEGWVHEQYYSRRFNKIGFIGWAELSKILTLEKPGKEQEIKTVLHKIRYGGPTAGYDNPNEAWQKIKAAEREGHANSNGMQSLLHVVQSGKQQFLVPELIADTSQNAAYSESPSGYLLIPDSVVSNELEENERFHLSLCDRLVARKHSSQEKSNAARHLTHAPLLPANMIDVDGSSPVAQYGFIGNRSRVEHHNKEDDKIFHNTNLPFSTFVCGVQGSGKSHTTACLLENVLIRSRYLGKLHTAAAALIFNYGEFSSSGLGFNISEATYLATAKESFPNHAVKKVTVLTSPSNGAIIKHYERIKGVKVMPFKIKSDSLDIRTLRSLMAVSDKSEEPLYMARVEHILRDIAATNTDSIVDYALFIKKLWQEKFDPAQTNMLKMRLQLLESFLDTAGNAEQPTFRPGEVTIIDLSDPFVTSHTACILFRICLEQFMHSASKSKMVVLDEAHKYMLDTPGASDLTSALKALVRLERHRGVRVVISTQEPTISTDLIALCSMTVIHRFTSPAWLAALKNHIGPLAKSPAVMDEIENLETGQALVYCPRAVLGRTESGEVKKATGRLMKLDVRQRLTFDGGESVMAT